MAVGRSRVSINRLALAALAAAGFTAGCGGGGEATGSAGIVSCELLKRWGQGEAVVYRFSDSAEEWVVSVSIEELRPGYLKYATREDQVRGGNEWQEGTSEISWDGECPESLVAFGSAREALVMGQDSPWGTSDVESGTVPPQEQSCESATRQTETGTFAVERCLKYGALGPAEPITDDTYLGEGAAPGGGFVAREVSNGTGKHAVAVIESWNGI